MSTSPTPSELLKKLHDEQITLAVDGDALRCTGPRLPPGLMDQVREMKQPILDALAHEAETFEAVLGQAGTGKTYLMRSRALEDPSVVLTATTGIAAVNLGAGTINSLLKYYDTESLRDRYVSQRLHQQLRALSDSGITRIVIDEVSMLSGDQLTLIVRAIARVNETRTDGKRIRLTLCGDFCQLPPVKEPFAFESVEWMRFAGNTKVLREIRRQSDANFITALNHIRRGDAHKAAGFFARFLHDEQDTDFEGATIMGRNAQVDAHNQLRLDALPGRRIMFAPIRVGKLLPEWKQIPDLLELKEGAVVMILANRRRDDDSEYLYVNGDLGTLLDKLQCGSAVVKLQRTGEDVVVDTVERQNWRPSGKKTEPKIVDGWIRYMPLRCAYATTCFKAQGITMDRVQIDLRDYFIGHPGSLYVALSRARTAAGLRLVGDLQQFVSRYNVDPRVQRWL